MDKENNISIKTIARKAGVSVATVSRVIHNNPVVTEKTREKVQKAIREFNYEINTVARNLKTRKTKSIGIVVGKVFSRFYSTMLRSVEVVANNCGYNVILLHSEEDPEKELRCLRTLNSLRASGVIIISTGANEDYLKFLIKSGIHIVLLDRSVGDIKTDIIQVDNFNGAFIGTKFLIDLGYKKIGIINGPLNLSTARERLNGYLKALQLKGLKREDKLIMDGNFDKNSGIVLSNELLNSSIKPDAIFTMNLDLTLGTLITLTKRNIKIPNDIGLIAFDDSDWLRIFSPKISVITYPINQFGKIAAKTLINRIENSEKKFKFKTVTLDTKLIDRDSLKRINSQ